MKQKILSLLVLLLTAATGAWAQEQSETIATTDNIVEGTHFTISNGGFYADGDGMEAFGGITVTPKNGETITKVVITCTYQQFNVNDENTTVSSGTKEITNGGGTITVTGVNATTFTFTCTGSGPQFGQFVVYYGAAPADSDVEVATNAAEGETYFTEATFEMPAFDATAEYEMVRDMSVQMTTKVGDGADGADYRIRLKKDGTAWALADITLDALKALITVHDGIEDKNLAYYGQDAVCALQIFAVDDNDQPTGNAIDFANLTPGRYVAKAVAADGSDYVGETAFSNVIVLFQGYEATVPAKEFITYYKEENLKLDAETSAAGELYTVSTVTDNSVVLSNKLNVVPANSPMLVYNPTDEEKTFLLIPTDETLLGFMYYAGFKGTLVATTIAASTDAQTNYAFNGMAFVYVKNAISIAANKAWLEVAGAENNVRALTIVFGADTATGISNTVPTDDSNVVWYDLNGRKIGKKPTQKGVYILNGKKVAVK